MPSSAVGPTTVDEILATFDGMSDKQVIEEFRLFIEQRRQRRKRFWQGATHLAAAMSVSLFIAASVWTIVLWTMARVP